jgi:hypothetical protein
MGSDPGLSDQNLDEMLAVDGEFRAEKSYVAAQLFACEAKIRDANGSIEAAEFYLRFLYLLLKSCPRMDDELKAEAAFAIDQNLEGLRDQAMSPEFYRLLAAHFESRGKFAKAEDAVFELAECEPEEALAVGVAFYKRALAKTDDELERGNLPRGEVREGLQELRTKCGAKPPN